jgi:hypothetical protein
MSAMRQKSIVHPDQLPLRFESHADLDSSSSDAPTSGSKLTRSTGGCGSS